MERAPLLSKLFATVIFLSAFLLFLVQPLIARVILPWFGGTSAVWTTCLLFFQAALLIGYLYSFWSAGSLRPRKQAMVHLALLACGLLALPILPGAAWKQSGGHHPELRILALLTVTVGLPYFTLSSTGPLLQAWYSRLHAGRMPYRLYALSNAGSLLALLGYPALVEPLLRVSAQAYVWSIGYGLFVLTCGAVALLVLQKSGPESHRDDPFGESPRPSLAEHLLWLALAACPAALLLATTSHLSQNIAPIPLLWVAPLALYLLTLVLCFESERWRHRGWTYPLLLISIGAMTYFLFPDRRDARLLITLPVFMVGLFLCCMACHGELARRRPMPRWLTSFYLMLAAGGAAGGLFAGLLSPLIFRTFLELPISLLACSLLIGAILARPILARFGPRWAPIPLAAAAGVSLTLLYLVTIVQARWLSEQRLVARNFYGSLQVLDYDSTPPIRYLVHGTIQHGSQALQGELRRKPISYYGPHSGAGLAIEDRQRQGPVHLGVIGLGSGALAAYGRTGDSIRFYEINPLVETIARGEFSYLADTPAKLKVVMGDARRSLETEPPQQFDVLAVDAFSGDAIPVHLLTAEAFSSYFRHLKPAGILAVHISNTYLKLEWVVRLAAQALGKRVLLVSDTSPSPDDPVMNASDWMLVSSDAHAFEGAVWEKLGDAGPRPGRLTLWTDESSNLLSVLY